MSLVDKLKALGFRPRIDFECWDDGDGVIYIAEWRSSLPQPSETEIEAAEAAPPRRMLRKSTVQQRLIDVGLMDAAHAALWADKAAYARWFVSDHPKVNADDPEALALLEAIGADPDVIMAPE
jgi:hypothetical protein